MVTMKTLSNSKGISLVILIVAMTLITILGVSFVSIMASKQKGFLYQIDSYRALNLANAGVEYAIRYASEGLDSNGDSILFSDQDLSTLGRSLGGGTFSIDYAYSQTIDTDRITVTGTYGSSSRRVRLSRFRRYLSPLTLVPSAAPQRNGAQTIIPVICNNENNVTVNLINLTVNASGAHLQQIQAVTAISSSIVFDFNDNLFPPCSAPPSPPCQDTSGILLPNGISVPFSTANGLHPHTIRADDILNYYLLFSDASPNGRYAFTLTTATPAVESIIVFHP
ncbi:MAG: hypothetical protein A4E65_02702 [Syntrophorhabdus sp. PtaU1.Bin153]|nr:MAG: hypothetical protein A4E65_02702 [Syntrophorhabdus sp. PtaU1.Bin153]